MRALALLLLLAISACSSVQIDPELTEPKAVSTRSSTTPPASCESVDKVLVHLPGGPALPTSPRAMAVLPWQDAGQPRYIFNLGNAL